MSQERGTALKRSHALRWWIGGIAVVVGGVLAYVAATRPTTADEYFAGADEAEVRADAEFAETLRTARWSARPPHWRRTWVSRGKRWHC